MRLGPEIGLQNFLKQKRKLLKRLKRKQKKIQNFVKNFHQNNSFWKFVFVTSHWLIFWEEQLRIKISGERESWERFYSSCPNFSILLWFIWCYILQLCIYRQRCKGRSRLLKQKLEPTSNFNKPKLIIKNQINQRPVCWTNMDFSSTIECD
jgi:hypothetical protein